MGRRYRHCARRGGRDGRVRKQRLPVRDASVVVRGAASAGSALEPGTLNVGTWWEARCRLGGLRYYRFSLRPASCLCSRRFSAFNSATSLMRALVLIAKEENLLNLLRANERLHVVEVLACPLGQPVDSFGSNRKERAGAVFHYCTLGGSTFTALPQRKQVNPINSSNIGGAACGAPQCGHRTSKPTFGGKNSRCAARSLTSSSPWQK